MHTVLGIDLQRRVAVNFDDFIDPGRDLTRPTGIGERIHCRVNRRVAGSIN